MTRNAAIVGLIGALTVALGASQVTSPGVLRYGSVGITDAEVVQISNLVAGAGKPPWMILSRRSLATGRPVAHLFLAPDVAGPAMLRGRMMVLAADEAPDNARTWTTTGSYSYASVPAPGRQPGELRGPDDLGWPFILQGDLDDDDLIAVVAFVRSEPRIPTVPENSEPSHVARAPISSVDHRAAAVIVTLQTSEATFQRIWLARTGGEWVITRFDWWIV